MIQLAELGSVLAEPVKSSVHTAVQPDGGGGADALAWVVTMLAPTRTSAEEPASTVRRMSFLRWRGSVGGDMAGSFRGGGSEGDPQPAGGPAAGRERPPDMPWNLRQVGRERSLRSKFYGRVE
ncbi:hypothetical protein GCM10009557_30390 [Virgisporangium ochraceum]|uniref:Uncharacterized protein n=1 Tax=Virgisporangium ochraceum TaxID=65505 RepID=A0A8J3ZN62_9ACTN|nr:hypothetical protein Voc01_008300 [Virgisporangium ochraceum]